MARLALAIVANFLLYRLAGPRYVASTKRPRVLEDYGSDDSSPSGASGLGCPATKRRGMSPPPHKKHGGSDMEEDDMIGAVQAYNAQLENNGSKMDEHQYLTMAAVFVNNTVFVNSPFLTREDFNAYILSKIFAEIKMLHKEQQREFIRKHGTALFKKIGTKRANVTRRCRDLVEKADTESDTVGRLKDIDLHVQNLRATFEEYSDLLHDFLGLVLGDKYKTGLKTRKPFSTVVPVAAEAFLLVTLLNGSGFWLLTFHNYGSKNTTRQWTSSSGTWDDEGVKKYNELVTRVAEDRKEYEDFDAKHYERHFGTGSSSSGAASKVAVGTVKPVFVQW